MTTLTTIIIDDQIRSAVSHLTFPILMALCGIYLTLTSISALIQIRTKRIEKKTEEIRSSLKEEEDTINSATNEVWSDSSPLVMTKIPIHEKIPTQESDFIFTNRPFRAGDIVYHEPSGEEWILAIDQEGGYVMPSGYPNTMARAKDCELRKPSSDATRLLMLNSWAEEGKGYEHEQDCRTRAARRQLKSI